MIQTNESTIAITDRSFMAYLLLLVVYFLGLVHDLIILLDWAHHNDVSSIWILTTSADPFKIVCGVISNLLNILASCVANSGSIVHNSSY